MRNIFVSASIAGILLGFAGVGFAQQPATRSPPMASSPATPDKVLPLLDDRVWAETPAGLANTPALSANLPPIAGEAVLLCRMTSDGHLQQCAMELESSPGMGAEALKQASLYRVGPELGLATGTEVWAKISLRPSVIGAPYWLAKPTGRDLNLAFPARALRLEKSGRAVIMCVVASDGTLKDCVVESETPEGFGFGEAALSLQSLFRMSPQTVDGAPVGGAKITVPIVFGLR